MLTRTRRLSSLTVITSDGMAQDYKWRRIVHQKMEIYRSLICLEFDQSVLRVRGCIDCASFSRTIHRLFHSFCE
jgi:hypothetical protein